MIELFPYWKELNFDTQCELVRFGKALKKMMQNAPTVDAVEVVRCKECKSYDPGYISQDHGWCKEWGTSVRASGFCHHGERRTDG